MKKNKRFRPSLSPLPGLSDQIDSFKFYVHLFCLVKDKMVRRHFYTGLEVRLTPSQINQILVEQGVSKDELSKITSYLVRDNILCRRRNRGLLRLNPLVTLSSPRGCKNSTQLYEIFNNRFF